MEMKHTARSMDFATTLKVRVTDLNYGGHLANDKMLAYFHEARVHYLSALGVSEADIGDGAGLTQTEAYVHYKAELFLGEVVEIRIRVDEVGKARFRLHYAVWRPVDGVLAAEGYTVLAAFDYQRRRPTRLPPLFADLLRSSAATASG